MNVEPIPLLSDNYAWLLTQPESRECVVVDPSEAYGVAKVLQERDLSLAAIVVTHHHWDHVGGIEALADSMGPVEVVASSYDREQDRVPRVTQSYSDGDAFEILGERVECLMVPGHTLGAIAFYMPESKALFTGDTLFTAGCGRLFEGTPEQMHTSLSRLAKLPSDTLVYCGHEYTLKNLQFALALEPENDAVVARLAEVETERNNGRPTVPASLRVELATNPFLRSAEAGLAAAVGKDSPVEVFAEIRNRRNNF